MNLTKRIFFSASDILPVKLFQKSGKPNLLLPYHHVVSDAHLPHIRNMYPYKNVSQFTCDLDWLLNHFTPIHPDDLARSVLEKKPLKKNSFLLTFDDGFREVSDIIAPILLQKGVPAIFFVNPDFIDNKTLFYRCKLSLIIEYLEHNNITASETKELEQILNTNSEKGKSLKDCLLKVSYPERIKADKIGEILGISFQDFLDNEKPFLETNQINKLLTQGFTFGGHSLDHPHYKHLSENQQLEQTTMSLPIVSNQLNSDFKYFSFPHQDHTIKQSFFDALVKIEPKLLLFGTQNQMVEPSNPILHRFNAERPEMPLSSTAKGVLIFSFLRGLLSKDVIFRA